MSIIPRSLLSASRVSYWRYNLDYEQTPSSFSRNSRGRKQKVRVSKKTIRRHKRYRSAFGNPPPPINTNVSLSFSACHARLHVKNGSYFSFLSPIPLTTMSPVHISGRQQLPPHTRKLNRRGKRRNMVRDKNHPAEK